MANYLTFFTWMECFFHPNLVTTCSAPNLDFDARGSILSHLGDLSFRTLNSVSGCIEVLFRPKNDLGLQMIPGSQEIPRLYCKGSLQWKWYLCHKLRKWVDSGIWTEFYWFIIFLILTCSGYYRKHKQDVQYLNSLNQ